MRTFYHLRSGLRGVLCNLNDRFHVQHAILLLAIYAPVHLQTSLVDLYFLKSNAIGTVSLRKICKPQDELKKRIPQRSIFAGMGKWSNSKLVTMEFPHRRGSTVLLSRPIWQSFTVLSETSRFLLLLLIIETCNKIL